MTTLNQLNTLDPHLLPANEVRGAIKLAIVEFGSIELAAKALGWKAKDVKLYDDLEPVPERGGEVIIDLKPCDLKGSTPKASERRVRTALLLALNAYLGPAFSNYDLADMLGCDQRTVGRVLRAQAAD